MISRRQFMAAAGAAAFPAYGRGLSGFHIGVMDTTLRMASNPEALAVAAKCGVQAAQVTIGRAGADGRLTLASSALQGRYRAMARQHKVRLVSTYLDILHVNCLKDDDAARRWVREGIEITRKLDARILMLVFFGKCAVNGPGEMGVVATALRELAPEAKRAGVVLGFENTLSAQDQARVLDRVGSDAVKAYYDAGNATNLGGFDAPAEIRFLGRDRICQFHLKDKGYLGEGKVDMPAVLRAIADIGFQGYGVLETSSPSGDVEADLRKNFDYLRRIAADDAGVH